MWQWIMSIIYKILVQDHFITFYTNHNDKPMHWECYVKDNVLKCAVACMGISPK